MGTDATAKLLHMRLPKGLAPELLQRDGIALGPYDRDLQPILDGLVDQGLMRRAASGRYWWR